MTGTDRKAASAEAAAHADLIALVRAALTIADDIGLIEVGLRLDQALIELTGEGSLPDMEDGSIDDPAPATGFHSPGQGNEGESARLA